MKSPERSEGMKETSAFCLHPSSFVAPLDGLEPPASRSEVGRVFQLRYRGLVCWRSAASAPSQPRRAQGGGLSEHRHTNVKCERRDLNPRFPRWQRGVVPLDHARALSRLITWPSFDFAKRCGKDLNLRIFRISDGCLYLAWPPQRIRRLVRWSISRIARRRD